MVAGRSFDGRKPSVVAGNSVRNAGSGADFSGVPVDHAIADRLLDDVLRRVPARRRRLAPPPPDRDAGAVFGDIGLPHVGRTWQYARWGPAELLGRYRAEGPVSLHVVRGEQRVLVAGPEAIEQVLQQQRRDFGQEVSPGDRQVLRRGLGLLEFDEHRFHRAIMRQVFTVERLAGYMAAAVVEDAVGQWVPPRQRANRPVPVFASARELVLELAFASLLGVDPGRDRDRLAAAVGACAFGSDRTSGGRRARVRGRRVLEQYCATLLPRKRRAATDDVFSGLCHARSDEHGVFGDADVLGHLIFLLVSAMTTTPTALTAVAYYLGKHPDWQERVRAEADAVGGTPDLDRMPTLDSVVKESLRLMPPVSWLSRRAVRDTEILGRHVPAGTPVDLAYQVGHLLPEVWARPEVFDPHRFDTGAPEDRSRRFAWLPFGAGAHRCLGVHVATAQVKAAVATLVRDYTWEIPETYRIPLRYAPMTTPTDNAPMLLRRREK
ncbi:cytochrome P450 [Nocardia callitridis]|uniref:Cytochrome P450 n=1 Tax=Nocardia callitridis TaxID=648753 RepID=A0ABP9KCA9_9NOCA